MTFYLSKDNQKLGPYSTEQVRTFLLQGLVTPTDLIWADGWSAWLPITNVPGFAGVQSSGASTSSTTGPTTDQPQSIQSPQQSKKYAQGKNPVIACVLSLVIVGSGQFYNGDWAKGWFMLITCLFATIFSAGAMFIFWSLFSAFDAYRVASQQKSLGQYYPL